ncbi:methyltransferase-like protein 13-like [Hibiscus syriacus]|uniref:Methyltransferase-like protein 13-like n=1 Tax=Hibiscus syriacus TaxID=106335 RepID=A0A6A3BXY2_HIBSY|nr:methyltransferase-like protein 13-like [Hibiscus syriacus]
MISGGMNLVMTVIGFTMSIMLLVFICTRLICARIQLRASRRSLAVSSRSDLSVLERGTHGPEPVVVASFPMKNFCEECFSTNKDAHKSSTNQSTLNPGPNLECCMYEAKYSEVGLVMKSLMRLEPCMLVLDRRLVTTVDTVVVGVQLPIDEASLFICKIWLEALKIKQMNGKEMGEGKNARGLLENFR